MPKILVYKFLYFFFYAGDLAERGHVHVVNSKSMKSNPAKIWFENEIEIFDQGSLNQKELRLAFDIVAQNQGYLKKSWERFKFGKKVTLKVIQ